jgi:outer membrane PBP1 activator LpoA protein
VRYAPPAILALLAAALLAGCSGQTKSNSADDFQGDKKAVAQVVDDLSNAGSDKDTKEICTTILAPEVAAKLKQGNTDCQDVIEDQLKDANAFGLDVKSVEVTGNTATAQVESTYDGEDKIQTLRFRKDGQAWRLVGFAG